MARKLQPEDEETLRALTKRMLITIRFLESVQEFPSGAELRGIVEAAAAKRDLRTLRLLSREVGDMTITLLPHERDGLDALLRRQLGIDADAERTARRQQVAEVIRRGTIASEKERRRLEEYAEMLEVTGGDKAELDAVRRLLQTGWRLP